MLKMMPLAVMIMFRLVLLSDLSHQANISRFLTEHFLKNIVEPLSLIQSPALATP